MMEIVKAKQYWDFISEYEGISESDNIMRYTNIWGEQVLKLNSESLIINPNPNRPNNKLSLGGHTFPGGFYNIDESGNEVYGDEDFDEYIRIDKKVKLIEKVNEFFKEREFTLTVGPNNSVAVDDVNIVPDCYWHLPKKIEQLDKSAQDIIGKVWNFKRRSILDVN